MTWRTRRTTAVIYSLSDSLRIDSPGGRMRVWSLEDKELWWSSTKTKNELQKLPIIQLLILSAFSSYMRSTHVNRVDTSSLLWKIKCLTLPEAFSKVYLEKHVLPACSASLTQSMWLIMWTFFIKYFRGQQDGSVYIKVLIVQAWWLGFCPWKWHKKVG